MKIVDRYVLVTFIKNYLISFMVLIGMYIALDMVFNISSITQTNNKGETISMARVIYDIADFYFYQAFFFFVQLSGVITVAAAAFTLMRLSRFNELTALLAAGVPLLRVAASVIVAGAILNLVLLPIDQEYVIPQMIPKLIREHNEIHQSTIRTFAVHMMQDKYSSLFNAAMYYPGTDTTPAHLQYLDVIERKELLQLQLYADSAVWNAEKHRWDLTNGRIVPIAPPEQETINTVSKVDFYRSNITPDEVSLNLGKDYIQFLPISRINQLLNTKGYATLDLLRTKHLRFAQPISNVILLLLAISTVLTRQPEMLKMAAFKCMNLTGLCMATVFICYQLAGSPPSLTSNFDVLNFWPALMAWMPIFIFGPTSVYLLDHLKS